VHAGICDHRQWDTQIAPFAARYRVIRFDMRGFGQSDLPAGPASLSDDLRGLLDALGVERTAVIGCSMGGSTSLDFTLKHPDRVAALTLVGSGMSGGPQELSPDEAAIIEQLESADKAGDVEKVNALELRLWVDGPNRTPEQVTPGVRALVEEMNLANDTFNVRKTMDTLEAGIAGARKVVMPGLTHVPNMERPDEFNKTVLDFLAPIW
jgi:pimeloyl-ACP methyl ester carboxylesterase